MFKWFWTIFSLGAPDVNTKLEIRVSTSLSWVLCSAVVSKWLNEQVRLADVFSIEISKKICIFKYFLSKLTRSASLALCYEVKNVGVWFSLFDAFKSLYSLLLFVQLQFNSQKTGAVKYNRYNRKNRGKRRETLFLRGHFALTAIGVWMYSECTATLFQLLFNTKITSLGFVPALFCCL